MSIEIVAVDRDFERIDALFRLVRDVYATAGGMSETGEERYPDTEALARAIARIGERPGGLFLVAQRAGLLLGYLVVEPRRASRLRHTADLNMGVAGAARGRGVGRALLDEAMRRLAASGQVEIVYLMVRADNLAAVRLYERSGFERLATLERDTRIGGRYYDGVLMRRHVAGGDPGAAGPSAVP